MLHHVKINIAPQLDGTRQSEIARAAVKVVTTRQVTGNLLTLKELINRYHQSIKASLDAENGPTKQSNTCLCLCVYILLYTYVYIISIMGHILQLQVACHVSHWYCWGGYYLMTTARVISTVEKSYSLMGLALLCVK